MKNTNKIELHLERTEENAEFIEACKAAFYSHDTIKYKRRNYKVYYFGVEKVWTSVNETCVIGLARIDNEKELR